MGRKKMFASLIMFGLLFYCCITANAVTIVEKGTCGAEVNWILDSEGLLVISGTGEMTSCPWQQNHTLSIKTLVIENGVTSIKTSAFARCTNLKSATIPNSITHTGTNIFRLCENLVDVNLPDNLEVIEGSAFCNCSALTNIVIPKNVKSIEGMAFYGCSSLRSINIPENVTNIVSNGMVFSHCTNLESINVSEKNECYISVDGVLFDKQMKNLMVYPCKKSNTSYTIPDSVNNIETYAFYGCSLNDISIPMDVSNFEQNAFDYDSNIKNVYFEGNSSQWISLITRNETSSENVMLNDANINYNCKYITYSFDVNGGNAVLDITGYILAESPEITLVGATFLGWYDNSDFFGDPITFPYNSPADITLYAKWELSDECDILSIISPEGGTITDKTIDFKIASNISEVTPEFELSYGADWDLYSAATATKPLPSKTVIIPRGGITITYYVKVIAADNETVNTYTVNFYRNTKSISPAITASRDKVTITAANCDIYYTTDGSTPTTESTKYTGVFSAPSKATIKAIAVENGKDEISDVVTFEVPEYLTTTMTGLSCYDMLDGTCYYSIMIQSDGIPTGEFIVAIYDIGGRLIGIKSEPKTIDKEETIIDIVEIDGTPHTYKAFFWNSLGKLMPLCNNAEGSVIK